MRATLALAGITAVTLSCALAAGGQARSLGAALHADAYPRLTGIHVSGTKLVNGDGTTVVLHGIDRSGTEYACIQGWGIFDGPNVLNDDAQVPLMKAWGANEVLIGLNEDCWLGINGVRAAYGGKNYVKAIVHETKTLESYDIYPVISDFWMAPGTIQATDQDPMPDNSHSPAFWRSVANTFKGDPNIIFRLKEEPYPDNNSNSTAAWECWNKGDVQYGPTGSLTPISRVSHCDDGYAAVGMQSLINIIRGTGAKNVIEVPGIQYANTMTDFLSPGIRVHDTLSPPQLVADVDVYPDFNGCGTVSCYNREYAPVIKQMPFVAGETGVGGCTTTGVDTFMSWMNTEHSGYGGWAWDAWGGCGVLIASYNGTPTYPWGIDFKDRLLTLSGHPPPSPPHPTDGITIAQATPASCITTPSEKVQLSGAVPAGDDLVLVVAGQGYTGAASSVTGVNDNVNGAWTKLSNSGSVTNDGTHYVSYAVYQLVDSRAAPSGLTVTITGVAGQSGMSGIVLDLEGVASEHARAFSAKLNAPSTSMISPAIASVPADDLVLGLFGAYYDGETYSAPTGWNMDAFTGDDQCAAVAIDWRQTRGASTVKATVTSSGAEPYFAGALVLQPKGKGSN